MRNQYLRTFFYLCLALILFVLVTFWLVLPINGKNENKSRIKVSATQDKYRLIDKNKEVFVRGAAGNSQFKKLYDIGGNTIRTWNYQNLDVILDSAQHNNLYVIIGLPIVESYYLDFYNDEDKVEKQFQTIQETIIKYKSHPSVLTWIAGNELDFPYRFRYRKFYKAYREIVSMIKTEDPIHPVTTSLVNFSRRTIINLLIKVPDIDFISINTFGGKLEELRTDLDRFSWFWNGPYLLTEWGSSGYWETPQTKWGVPLEDSSFKKAEKMKKLYEQDIPWEDGRLLGTCVFFWGQKVEFTQTWYSLFGWQFNPTQSVAYLNEKWNGEATQQSYPKISYIQFDQYGMNKHLIIPSNWEITASAVMEYTGNDYVYHWQLMYEDWYYSNHLIQTDLALEDQGFLEIKGKQLKFITPSEEGAYRLYLYVKNKIGYVATANIPFYVVEDEVEN